MIRRWIALTYYLYALRLAALFHFYFIHYMLGGGRLFQPLLRQVHHVVQIEAVRIGGLAVGCDGVDDLRQVLRQQAAGLLRVDADCLRCLAEVTAQCVFNRARADRFVAVAANPALQHVAQAALLQLAQQTADIAAVLLHQMHNQFHCLVLLAVAATQR